jgi:predicted nucleic acid-binding protein
VRYWDASAVVPLVVEEPSSAVVREWLREDGHMVTWALTRLELASAVERRARQGVLSADSRREVLARFTKLAQHWDEVTDIVAVVRLGLPLLSRHSLRAADAAQLASALLLGEGDPASVYFVCLDQRLAETAEREGLSVVTWSA